MKHKPCGILRCIEGGIGDCNMIFCWCTSKEGRWVLVRRFRLGNTEPSKTNCDLLVERTAAEKQLI